MHISQLSLHHIRNQNQLKLECHPLFNFIVGSNGCGKTSVLEAIYLLGTGHSFRCRENAPLINHEQAALTVFAQLSSDETIGIEKSRLGKTRVKINGEFCQTSSVLAQKLPLQVIYQDIFQIIDAGPSQRRAILDWGMFHVKHRYLEVLKQYKRALKQRNTLLKQKVQNKELQSWTQQCVNYGEELDKLRLNYFKTLNQEFQRQLALLTEMRCELQYFNGWDKDFDGKDLHVALEQSLERDTRRGFTHYGPHNADIIISATDKKVKHHLSRGQQKIVLIALKVAQTLLVDKPLIYLIDDVAAELDSEHRRRVAKLLLQQKKQCFITCIDEQSLAPFMDELSNEMFHVKHLS